MRPLDSFTKAMLILLLLVRSLRAENIPRHFPSATEGTEDYGSKRDLASVLQDPPREQHERLSKALQILYSIQSGPRCHHQAALNLLNDCKFLENVSADAKDDSEARLDQLEIVYAARLAVCELMSANADIPPDCKVVTATKEACLKKRHGYGSWFSRPEEPKEDKLCYPETPQPKQFQRCINGLYSQSQSWTSLSNARQNAMVMCHASRDVIEREKSLSLYKNLGDAVSLMASTLEKYNEQIKVWLGEHDAIVAKIRTSSEQALHDIEEGVSTFENIKSAFRSFAGMMSRTAETYSEEVEQSLEKSRTSMEQHRQEFRQYHEALAETSLQQAFAQRAELESNHNAAVSALRSYHYAALETLQANHEAAIAKVEEVSQSVDDLQEKVVISSSNIEIINEGLVNVNRTVQRLDAATESLPDMIHMLTTVGGIFSNPQLFLAASVCLLGLWKANGPIAGYVIAACGLFYFLGLLGLPAYVKSCFGGLFLLVQSQNPLYLGIYGIASIVFLSYLVHARLRSTYLHPYQDERGQIGVLPSIEMPSYPAKLPHHTHGLLV